jgi:hypothetical protein
LAALILALAWLLPVPAAAQAERPADAGEAGEVADDLARARQLYLELDFSGAADAAQAALGSPGLREADRAAAYETLGCALVVLEREQSAREAFEALFRIDPYWSVREPSGSPRIRRFVETVRARVVRDAALDPALVLRLEVPRAARVGRATPLSVAVEGAMPASVTVRARGEGELTWRDVEAARSADGRFDAELPALEAPDELELYVVARDARGQVIGRAGGPLETTRLPVRAAEISRPLSEEPWLWALVGGGVVVVGAAIGIGIAASQPARAPDGTLPPGRVELGLVTF